MNILITDLCKALNKFSKVFVCGEGLPGKTVCRLLQTAGMEERIHTFIMPQIQEDEKESVGEEQIVQDEVGNDPDWEGAALLITELGEAERKKADILSEKFGQIFFLEDFIISEEQWEESSDAQFFAYARECYVWDNIDSLLELKEANEKEEKKIEQRGLKEPDEKSIVFVIGDLDERNIGIIEDLIAREYKVAVVEYGEWKAELRSALTGIGENLEYFKCRDIGGLLSRLIQYKPAVYCCQPVWEERRWVDIMRKHQKIFGRLAISMHDILAGGYVQEEGFSETVEEFFRENKYSNVWRYFEQEKVLLLSDCDFAERELRRASDERFLEDILEGYVWNQVVSLMEYQEKSKKEKIKIIQREMFQEVEEETIVFIVGFLSPRTVKIIGAMTKRGYKAVILEYGNWRARNVTIKPELMLYNVQHIRCEDIGELFYQAMQYKPKAYYFEPVWGNCSWPDIMIRHKQIFGKIVMAVYDVLNDSYVQMSDYRKQLEKYCLENADGNIWRYFSKEFLEEKKGFVYQGKSIQFLDYCNGYNIEEKADQETKLKICFISGSPQGLLDSTNANNGYVEEARIENILKVIGNREDCDFHIFVGTLSDEYKEICSAMEKEYSNFQVIYNTPHEELIQKISEYDYGCFLFSGGEAIPEMETANNKYYGSAYINSISNRYFDYIDAEIPIIATRPVKLCDLFDEYGIIVKMDITNIDINYLKENKMNYKKNMKKAKEELGIDYQIPRLIEFFEEL